MTFSDAEIKQFAAWLTKNGAQVLNPTNQYEVVRFRSKNRLHVVYRDKDGYTDLTGLPKRAHKAFKGRHPMALGIHNSEMRAKLAKRDGPGCYFCLLAMDKPTVEHLVPISKGGPTDTDNLVLCHEHCNVTAGNKPLSEKLEMRVTARVKLLVNEMNK